LTNARATSSLSTRALGMEEKEAIGWTTPLLQTRSRAPTLLSSQPGDSKVPSVVVNSKSR
jgi:hypothetical protein